MTIQDPDIDPIGTACPPRLVDEALRTELAALEAALHQDDVVLDRQLDVLLHGELRDLHDALSTIGEGVCERLREYGPPRC